LLQSHKTFSRWLTSVKILNQTNKLKIQYSQ
jgi:hypothetical protein